MKLYKNIGLSLSAVLVLAQTSCLKDGPNNASPLAGSNNVVEFQNTAVPDSYTSPFAEYDNGVNLVSDTGGFPVNINFTGPIVDAPVNITLTLSLSQTALDSFNNSVGTSFVIPPSDTYSFPTSVTIPKGSRQITVRPIVNTAPADYDYTASYCLPMTISASSYGVISSNYGTAIFTFVANNAFAGSYAATGFVFHPSAPRAINATYSITTAGQFNNTFPVGDLGGNGYYFVITTPAAGGAVSGYTPTGSTPASPASGLMTADNPGGTNYASSSPNAPGTTPWLSTKYNNTFDATNNIYWLHYGYATGGNGQNTFTRQFYEELVKQ